MVEEFVEEGREWRGEGGRRAAPRPFPRTFFIPVTQFFSLAPLFE